MSSQTGRLASVFLLGGAFLLGCTDATPDYCQKPSDCTGGRICDVARAVCISPDAAIGDYVLVHAGFALNTVDEDEAHKIFEHLEEMAELEEAAGDAP